VLGRVVALADDGGNPAHNSRDYTPRLGGAESAESATPLAPAHLKDLRPT
jgi:hypothetical protein